MEQLLDELIKNRKMKTDAQIELFEHAFESIFSEKRDNAIENLIKGFDDETENEEVMFSLVHAIEYFADIEGNYSYVKRIISNLNLMIPHAKEWAEIVILRIVNDDDAFIELKKIVSEKKLVNSEILKSIFEKLIKRNSELFEAKCKQLLALMK